MFNLENYHIFTWKGYGHDIDWNTIDVHNLNVQGDEGNARFSIFTLKLAYFLKEKWNLILTNLYCTRRTNYRHYPTVDSSTYDLMFTIGYRL